MKRILLTLLFLQYIINVNAQLSEGGFPNSYNRIQLKSAVVLPHYQLKNLDKASLLREDSIYPTPLRYSLMEEVNIDLKTGAITTLNSDNGEIWRYRIDSEDATSIQIIFKKFFIPPGAKLFLYNESYSQIAGAFTSANNREDSTFTIADFKGNHVILEYFEPFDASFKGILIISQIGHAYRDIISENTEEAGTGYVNINCAEGNDWQNEKHAVCKITFNIGTTGYLCSGALLNNTKQDGTPYFLTANHCINTAASAQTMVAYFNFEKEGCNGSTRSYKTLSGATLLTTGDKSDYTLLKFSNTPPANYLPYYAGWDITNTASPSTSIHHPEGLVKSISADFNNAISYNASISWEGGIVTPSNTHWQVNFDVGKTAGGSSGAPLFNSHKQVIGQLHGGDETYDFYGKFSYSWSANNTGYEKLIKYLDPDNSGTNVLNGYAPSDNFPGAFFSVPSSSACISAPIKFHDASVFKPASRKWVIDPATYTFVDGTGNYSADPVIQFNQPGPYDLKLVVSNAYGKDSMQIADAINIGSTIDLNLNIQEGSVVCYSDFDSLTLTASGANEYIWNISDQTINPFYFSKTDSNLAIIKQYASADIDTTYHLTVKLHGTQGICEDSLEQTVLISKQLNDNIANAIPLVFGSNGPYSNTCAGTEQGEPYPPHTSCTGQNSWCDEYGTGDDILENSVWFKFTAPTGGKVSLSSAGFDNEIAIYKANSYQDILNGNYTLVAANDDASATNPLPKINETVVVPGNVYWVQVDGSGGGAVGSFTLSLTDTNPSTDVPSSTSDGSVKIYPQPAGSYVNVASDLFLSAEHISLEVYSITGAKILSGKVEDLSGDFFTINISGWVKGLYILKLNIDNRLVYSRIAKQ